MATPPATKRKPTPPPAETFQAPPTTTGAGSAAATAATTAAPATALSVGLSAAAIQTVDEAVDALEKFLRSIRFRNERWLRATVKGRPAADVADAIAEENEREWHFQSNAQQRFRNNVRHALRQPETAERRRLLQIALDQEQRYAKMRAEAMAARGVAAVERVGLRRESPQGVLWQLGNRKEHTPDCVAMHGKVWPWHALDYFRFWPPVHANCGCELKSYKWALANGYVKPGALQDVEQAIRRLSVIATMREEEESLLPMAQALADVGMGSVETFGNLLREQLEATA